MDLAWFPPSYRAASTVFEEKGVNRKNIAMTVESAIVT